ncbi:hypothetical protein [Paraglaciecola sp. L3A3]|uniref:hypothetical protein n=1 Tax=Paraglaciecola sp. L3A3 TaxID=2686358 RepID=UPI00131D770B|nr:hypothetical protein [Paraglaciecola sp. L3A3]
MHTVSFVNTLTIEQSIDSIKSIGLTKVDTYRGDQHVDASIKELYYGLDKNTLDKVKAIF